MNSEQKYSGNSNELIFDYSEVKNPARIAIYDDLKSSPRIVEVSPNETKAFIGELAANVYNEANAAGGKIAYSVIKQVAENFIHANFNEVVVSIMPGGNQIKFSDQGPGIKDKEKAKLPGFSSATQQMKQYIDGVGSGLPIAGEFLKASNGELIIEDNVDTGTVVTLNYSTSKKTEKKVAPKERTFDPILQDVTKRGISILVYLRDAGLSGNKDISQNVTLPESSTNNELKKLQELNLVEKIGTKRQLTKLGREVANTL